MSVATSGVNASKQPQHTLLSAFILCMTSCKICSSGCAFRCYSAQAHSVASSRLCEVPSVEDVAPKGTSKDGASGFLRDLLKMQLQGSVAA